MSKIIVIVAALLLVVGQVYAPGATAGEPGRPSGEIPQRMAFDHEHFLGDHTHLFGNMKDLGKWGNSLSSLIILSGTGEFFDDEDFKGTNMGTLGPGMYAHVTDKGLKNNRISSVRLAGVQAGRNGRFGLVIGVARQGDYTALQDNGTEIVVDDLRAIELNGS
jgi:hypothetical protein